METTPSATTAVENTEETTKLESPGKVIFDNVMGYIKTFLNFVLIGLKWVWQNCIYKLISDKKTNKKDNQKVEKIISETAAEEKITQEIPPAVSEEKIAVAKKISEYQRPSAPVSHSSTHITREITSPKIESTPPDFKYLRPTSLEKTQDIINNIVKDGCILQLNMFEIDTKLAENIFRYIQNIRESDPGSEYYFKNISKRNDIYLFYPIKALEVHSISETSLKIGQSINPKLLQLRCLVSDDFEKISECMCKCIMENTLFFFDCNQVTTEDIRKVDYALKAHGFNAGLRGANYKSNKVFNDRIRLIAPDDFYVSESRDFAYTDFKSTAKKRSFM
jgi:hypothetical protein